MAFTGAAPSIPPEKSIFRFQIVSKLFSTGALSLGVGGEDSKLPPSDDQLEACEQEIGYFSSLIRKGVLDSLPKTDSMLVKLIQHSLQLQFDSFEGNDYARFSCFPGSDDDKEAKKMSPLFWRMTHPLYFDVKKIVCRNVEITDFPFDRFHDKGDKTYKMLLYPTSNIMLSCITLVANWVNHVSRKKIRQNRLSNSLKALQKDLLTEADKLSKQTVKKSNTGITFEEAFSVKPSMEVGIGLERVSILKREAASCIQLIESLCMKDNADHNLSISVWENMSDSQMKKRRFDIIGFRRNTDEYSGDVYLLLTTARLMATLFLVQMNMSPWHLSVSLSVTRIFTGNLQPERESLFFPLSCIFACLDCLCDLEVGPQVFPQFYQIIILAFRNLSTMVLKGERNIATDHIKSNCVLYFNPILMKCFTEHLVSSRGSTENFHLRLCLSTIRAIQTFIIVHYYEIHEPSIDVPEYAANESQDVPNDENGDDMWGDLDDSDLAALDLSCATGGQSETHQHIEIWDLLSDALEQSKVSSSIGMVIIFSKFVHTTSPYSVS